jgi:AsmA protein
VNAAFGLKRLAIAAAGLIAAVLVSVIGVSLLLPAASVRDAVKAEIRGATGLDPVLGDDISLSLFPSGSVRFRNVVLANQPSGEPAVAADELVARLRYFPLLAGRIEIADVTLVRPTIKVAFSAGGESNWSGLISSLARALAPQSERTPTFSEIGIQDGTVILYDARRDATERLEGLEFQVAWPSISRSFGANGHFTWHKENVEASLTLTDFLAALTGDRSGLKIRLSSAPLTLAWRRHRFARRCGGSAMTGCRLGALDDLPCARKATSAGAWHRSRTSMSSSMATARKARLPYRPIRTGWCKARSRPTRLI